MLAVPVWVGQLVISKLSIEYYPSYKEPMVNALAPTTDEGRDWLR
jgi:hypothetical protein